MQYRIKYLPIANRDILAIAEHVSSFSPVAAGKLLDRMETLIADLSQLPYLWEAYPEDPFYRRIVLDAYLVFYHVNEADGSIEIHRVLHGVRDIPNALKRVEDSRNTTAP
ncbi:MAG: type II toxin-antitoxin system RelE/ParE family toxin [Coriobacteriales bacterium]|jgi:plasmid stabilization system protein ParE|nr:type II toxin-antitoxin system RelE/ParE family toxin [Coriobacteriales bacterium]